MSSKDEATPAQAQQLVGRNYLGPWNCPVCGSRLDCQSLDDNCKPVLRQLKAGLFCHHCRSYFYFYIRHGYPHNAKDQRAEGSAGSTC
jgi:hypothetical protein